MNNALANEHSQLYRRWNQQVVEPPSNDFVVLVSASSTTPVSGTGKTTLLLELARKFDRSSGPFDAEKQATLDVGELAYELAADLPAGSAILADEIQGTPGADGFDSRRGMKTEVVDGIKAILANRNDNYTILLGAQQIGSLDKRLIPLIDIWILIRDAPPQPRASVHTLRDNDFNLSSTEIRTPRIETLSWEKIPHSNENYKTLEQMKEKAKTRGAVYEKDSDDSDDSGDREEGRLPRAAQKELAQGLRDAGHTVREIADNDRITYGRTWIVNNTEGKEEPVIGEK